MTIQDDLMGAIYLATGDEEPIASLLAVFGGGEIENQIGQTRQIAGIKSYDTLLPNYDSTRFGIEADDDDVEGNLVLVPEFPNM